MGWGYRNTHRDTRAHNKKKGKGVTENTLLTSTALCVKATLDVVMIITPPVCPNLNLRTCPAFQHTTAPVTNITPGANFTFRT